MIVTNDTSLVRNTTHKVVIPFYAYAAFSFLAATVLLLLSSSAFTLHYFHPNTLAITHTMALGWGTMIILGASHQLVPVLIESKLYSDPLAYASFFLAAIGIPLLVYAFWNFQFDVIAKTGGVLVNAAIFLYLVNLAVSISNSKKENVHAIFVFTAAAWLLITTIVGLLLIYNFTASILPADSLHYLSLHAHLGIVGWFLLMVIGVGSRLIPMFLISKYDDPKLLWYIYFLVNGSLISFAIIFLWFSETGWNFFPLILLMTAIALFIHFCLKAYKERIRKNVDEQMRISLLSVGMMGLPLVISAALILMFIFSSTSNRLVLSYGFTIFFGWLTAIILGMTFKTLPFIIWNKVYHTRAGFGKTPNPKDLFSSRVFNIMAIHYIAGFVIFSVGIVTAHSILLQLGTILLIITSVLYNWSIIRMLAHKPAVHE